MSATTLDQEAQVHITRVIAAPRDLVFQAWTDPALLVNWYAPSGCTLEIKRLRAVTGGNFLTCIHNAPMAFDCWVTGQYLEVDPPARLVLTMRVCDPEGNPMSSAATGHDGEWPEETTLTVTFEETGERQTRLTLHQNVSQALAEKTGAYPSWLQMLDRLEDLCR
jgi:uncharacterized protein YndB with AHSA1/START domain